jgi:hypothetical protein
MDARTYLADELAERLDDGWRVIPWDDKPTLNGPTVLFYRSQVVQTPEAPTGSWSHTMTGFVASARQLDAPALDELDALLDAVLIALHDIPGVLWLQADYVTLADTYPAFKILVRVYTKPATEEPAPAPDPEGD